MAGWGRYRNRWIYIFEPWAGMSAYFVLGRGADPDCQWGVAGTFEKAFALASELIDQEAGHEQSPRGRS